MGPCLVGTAIAAWVESGVAITASARVLAIGILLNRVQGLLRPFAIWMQQGKKGDQLSIA
jgi:hypothetical protein